MNKSRFTFWLLLAATTLLVGSTALLAASLESQTPPPEVRYLVEQNKGNIRTTVANWGLIGGGDPYYPSGEWPKGSGRNYLAEIKYWMGASLASGDTALADTDNDFLPMVAFANADNDYGIAISTDHNTYAYDENDTVGLGVGRPAYGWRVWDNDTHQWGYNKVWDPITNQYVPGGPASLQESYYRFSDDALGAPALGLEISHTVYQWNYSYNQDYLFVVLEITNASDNDYENFAFGLYCDFDIGGADGTGENGRLGDLVATDTSLNLAWTYDADGYDRGWGPQVTTGIMGTRYIETPDDIGMTSFRTGQWEKVPNDDNEMFAYISQGAYDDPIPPADQYYLQCTSGIDLPRGKTIRIGYALIAGYDEADFRAKAQMAQAIYNNHFIGPEPPKPSMVNVLVGDGQARLSWDRTAETSVDPMSGLEDFAGFKVYRSTDRGQSWGKLERHPDGSVGPDYVPLAIWRIDDLDEPIPHTFVDTNLTNGYEYWYSVVAFDKGDTTAGVGALQTAFGRPTEDVNAVSVTPKTNPAGYYDIEKTLTHSYSGNDAKSGGDVVPMLFDDNLLTGEDYEVGFQENDYYTSWYVLNSTTGDTLIDDQVDQTGDIASAPVVDGIRVMVVNGEREPRSYAQTSFSGSDTTLYMDRWIGTAADGFGLPRGGDIHFRSTYELRFTEQGSEGYSFYDDVTPIDLPFEVWNTTSNEQVIAEIYHLDDATPAWNPTWGDYIIIVNLPYDGQPHPEGFPYNDVWVFRIEPTGDGYATGDVYEIAGAPVNGAEDKFFFKAPGVDEAAAKADMEDIRVVPNPYIGRADWEVYEGERRIEFTHLPREATVNVYTLSGDLVISMPQPAGGTLVWDLLSENGQGIAPGLYFYHVASPVGDKTGKFAIVK